MTPPGLAIDSTKIALVRSVIAASKLSGSSESAQATAPAEVLEGMGELVDRAAVQLAGRHELVAGLQERVEDHHLRGVAGGDRERRRAALQRRHALLQDRVGRIADAAVDVPEGLQPEERGGVVDVVEDEGGGLVDRRRPGAGRRVGDAPAWMASV